jgi:hypothetical protein
MFVVIKRFCMNIYINKKEIDAIHGAWEEVNDKIEGMDEEEYPELANRFREILRGLESIIEKTR